MLWMILTGGGNSCSSCFRPKRKTPQLLLGHIEQFRTFSKPASTVSNARRLPELAERQIRKVLLYVWSTVDLQSAGRTGFSATVSELEHKSLLIFALSADHGQKHYWTYSTG
jgi:hypothetical protein